MKKFYLSLAAAMMLSASTAVNAQDGKTCDTAMPFPTFPITVNGESLTEETWYTVTVNDLSMFPASSITTDMAEITIYEGCDGAEATPNGVNCYFLYPGIEYKMKIVPKELSFLMNISSMDILSMANAPAGMYCVKPIVLQRTESGTYAAVTQALGRTLWYQRDFDINGNLNITEDGVTPLDANLAKVELKRGDCKAVSSIGESAEIIPGMVVAPTPFAKAGTNLMAITFAKSNVDTGEKRNPGTEYETPIYACSYEISNPVIVNSSNEAVITLSLEAGKEYVMHYDSDYALEEGTPSVKVVEGVPSSINTVEANKKTDITVSENPTDGNFTVSSYLLADGGEIALYDMAAKKVFGTKAQEGAKEQNVQLAGVKQGTYLLVVYGRGRSASTKLIVK